MKTESSAAANGLSADDDTADSRGRSTVEFPYVHLEEAVKVAAAIHEAGGRSCEWSQVAALLNQSAKSGAFRLKMLAARTFGLLSYKGQQVELTELGVRTVDPALRKAALVEAFLAVPLFNRAFNNLRDSPIPPNGAIENHISQIGVTPKQTAKARQVFIRSARFAGFLDLAGDRLVKPIVDASSPSSDSVESPTESQNSKPHSPEQHPFITGLLMELPDPDSPWPLGHRVKWLRTAANIFDMIYEDGTESGEIRIQTSTDGDLS